MAEAGQLIDRDQFTCTVPGQPFQDVNWLTQLCYYGLYEWGGLDLVRLVNALLLALTLAWLVVFCRRAGGSAAAAAGAGVFVFFGLWQVLTIRPQTFSLLLFVVLYDLLDRAGRRRGWLLAAPPLLALWANLHGAFPAGLLLIGCFLAAAAWEAWRRGARWRDRAAWALAVCLAASTLATLVNPYGWGIYQYVSQTAGRAANRAILEWLPPSTDLLIGKVWVCSLVLFGLLSLAAWWLRGRPPAARTVALTLCFLPLACGSLRMVPWWLIVLAPVASSLLTDLVPSLKDTEEARPSWGAAAALALLLGAAALSVPGLERWSPLARLTPRASQVDAGLEAVSRRVGAGRVFSRFEWGEYLSWAGAPRLKVFADARIEIYPDDVWEKYLRVTRGADGWQQTLDEYAVDYLVLDEDYHGTSGLLAQVDRSARWRRVLRLEDGVALFERASAVAGVTRPRRATGP
jgi:hypothetical protein